MSTPNRHFPQHIPDLTMLLITLAFVTGLTGGALAQPANDLFRNRTAITEPGTFWGNITDATSEAGEPALGGRTSRRTVWWTYTPSQRGLLTIDHCNYSSATLIGVYTGNTLGSLTEIPESRESLNCWLGRRVRFDTEAGVTYQIAAGNENANSFGGFWMSVRLQPAPANDLFANRITIAEPGTVPGSIRAATVEAGQPELHGSTDAPMVWWSYTPDRRGRLSIDVCGWGFNARFGVYAGNALGSLTPVAESSGRTRCNASTDPVVFDTEAGVTYQIAVDGRIPSSSFDDSQTVQASSPDEQEDIRITVGLEPAPENDLFANRTVIPRPGTITGTAVGATAETGQPTIMGQDNRPLAWWSFTPAVSGELVIDTEGSSFDTILAVYTGDTLAGLRQVAVNDNARGLGRQSRVTFEATAGTAYRIAVGPARGPAGSIRLTVAPADPVGFSGGGAVFAPSDACGPALGTAAHAVTIHYSPAELNGLPSELTLAWPEGSEHLVLWGAMAASEDFLGAAGRQSWSRFVFYPTRPRMRVVTRQVTRPAGTALAQAEEVMVRLRAQNFAAIPGCAVTIAATLRRGG